MHRLLILVLTLTVSYAPAMIGAALANELDADMPLASIPVSLQPDPFTGALTGSIPIEVPP